MQVVELQLGMHSEAFWGEVALLHRCTHPRIVPVYGVAIEVGCAVPFGPSARKGLLLCPLPSAECCEGIAGVSGARGMAGACICRSARNALQAARMQPPCSNDAALLSCSARPTASFLCIALSMPTMLGVSQLEATLLTCCHRPPPLQGQLLLVAMQLMLGGSLREALLDPQRQELLRWENRCAGGKGQRRAVRVLVVRTAAEARRVAGR